MSYSRKYREAMSRKGRAMALARWRRPQVKREPSPDDLYWRMLEDRRGTTVREGCTYRASQYGGEVTVRAIPWRVQYSVRGRVDQYDIVVEGEVWVTGGVRRLSKFLKV